MKKIITLSVLATGLLLAYNAEVKKSDMTLTVNEKEKALKKGEKLELKGGDIVCYKSGDGRLIIKGDGYKKQLNKKSSPCRSLPLTDSKKSNLDAGKLIASVFAKAKEKSVNGVSRKSTETEEQNVTVTLNEKQKYIKLENNTWGPMPILLTVYDSNNTKVKELEYDDGDDLNISFLIPTSDVKEGYVLKVTNTFDEALATVTIRK